MKPLLIALACFAIAGCQAPGAAGSEAPDFEVESLQTANVKTSLKSFRGKVVILDFWATWCGPCKESAPYVEGMYSKYREKGLEAMAITDEDRGTVLIGESGRAHRMPVYLDPNRIAFMAYGVESLPTIIVIGRDGKVVYATVGFSPDLAKDMDAAIVKALG